MNLISVEDFENEVSRSGWVELAKGRISPKHASISYRHGEYEPCGVVGSDLAELFLNNLMPTQIKSGYIRVYGMGYPEKAQTVVIDKILSLLGHHDVNIYQFVFGFEDDYRGIAGVISWCLACAWSFDFFAKTHRFGLSTNTDESLTIFWPEEELTRKDVPTILPKLGFVQIKD